MLIYLAHSEPGTSVILGNLFKTVPVRHKEFEKHVRREYARCLQLLQAYALVVPAVKLTVSNQGGGGGGGGGAQRSVVLQTAGGQADTRACISCVYGAKQVPSLLEVRARLDGDADTMSVAGFISKPEPGCARAAGDRQHYYVNSRPVEMPKIERAVNEVYRSFSSLHVFPFVLLDFRLPPSTYDGACEHRVISAHFHLFLRTVCTHNLTPPRFDSHTATSQCNT